MFPPSPPAGRFKPAQTGAHFQQLNHGGQFQTLTVLRIRFRPNSDETWRKVLWLTAAGWARLHSSLSCSQPQFQIFNFNVRKNKVHTWLHSSSNLHQRLKQLPVVTFQIKSSSSSGWRLNHCQSNKATILKTLLLTGTFYLLIKYQKTTELTWTHCKC